MLECPEESIYAPQFKIKQLNKEITDILISLYKDFREIEDEVAGDFIERNLPILNTSQDHFIICELFMHFIKHEKFLEKFIQEFYKRTKRIIQTDENILIVLCYLIVLHTSQNHLEHVAQLLIATSQRKVAQLTSFLCYETSVLLLTQCASTYFDQEYIKEYILKEVLEDGEIFKKLHKYICKHRAHTVKDKKKLTVPQHMNVLSHLSKVPRPPNNSRNLSFGRIKPCHIPETTYTRPITEKKIQVAHEENRRNSAALLAEAQLQRAHLTQPAKAKEVEVPVVPDIAIIKAKPPPEFKEPELPVKMNYGTVLRQAARIVKEEEKEIKRVKNLTVGALDYTLFEKLYDELKNKEEQEHLQSIEKKHLTGLITYEEAILAKRNLLQTNKEKRALFEEQRKELEEHLKEWRQTEEEKIKQIIQKTQQIQKLVEEKKRDVLDKKQKLAKEVSEESRTIMAQVLKERTEELNRKIELIKEIRTLNSYRIIRKKEFDDTETMNIGLFCEMSIAELNERLSMLRAEMKEELEMRQKRIKEEKFRQKELLNEMQKLIEFNQIERKRVNAVSEPKRNIEVPESEEITNLRRKLEQTRERRKAGIL